VEELGRPGGAGINERWELVPQKHEIQYLWVEGLR
jgi:hypothetical protein